MSRQNETFDSVDKLLLAAQRVGGDIQNNVYDAIWYCVVRSFPYSQIFTSEYFVESSISLILVLSSLCFQSRPQPS